MPESKKVVIKVDVHDDKCKRKALKAVSSLPGIESLSMDMKDRKLTLIGDIDPVEACGRLKKWHTEILTVGPAKEEKKDGKKDEKKVEKTEEEKKKEAEAAKKKKEEEEEAIRRWVAAYRLYNPCMTMTPQYCVQSVDDYPNNNCVIS